MDWGYDKNIIIEKDWNETAAWWEEVK